jgi:hypothetical protein
LPRVKTRRRGMVNNAEVKTFFVCMASPFL